MVKGIRLEMYRAFHNTGYVVALLAATVLALLQFFLSVVPRVPYIGVTVNIAYPHSVFNSCLMLDMESFYSYLYYFAIILLATLPFGISYYTDLREGYVKNIYTRMDRKGYLVGKYLAVFVSAGTICVLPLILNTLLTAMCIPSLIPQIGTAQFSVCGTAMLKQLFYTHPWIYLGVYLMIDFVMAGLFACIALVVAKLVYNRYLVLFFPFLCFVLIQTIAQFLYYNAAGPFNIMDPQQRTWEAIDVVCIEMLILFVVTFAGFYWMGGKKHDAL